MQRIFSTFGLFFLIARLSFAGTVWDEAISGDLSSNPGTPTPVTLVSGDNFVSGSVSNADDVRDYFTFTLGADQQLSSLRLLRYEDLNVGGNGNRGYHAINLGETSQIPGGANTASFLGGDHLDAAPENTDILPDLAAGTLAGNGFETLGSGTYTYVVQQTGPELTGYSLNFVVNSVPEPSSSVLAILAIVTLLSFRVSRHV